MLDKNSKQLTDLFGKIYSIHMKGQPYPKAYGRDGKIFNDLRELYHDKTDDLIRDFFRYWKSGVSDWVSDKAPTPQLMKGCLPNLQKWLMDGGRNEIKIKEL